MKAKVVQIFFDKRARKTRREGEVFELSPERAEEIARVEQSHKTKLIAIIEDERTKKADSENKKAEEVKKSEAKTKNGSKTKSKKSSKTKN